MKNRSRFLALGGVLMLTLVVITPTFAVHVDPPERVIYLSDHRGEVSHSPAGEERWVGVVRNRPLIRGDRLWTDFDGLVELQLGSTAIRLGENTGFEVLDLTDRSAQLQLTQGTLSLSVRRLPRRHSLEVATPTLAFVIQSPGRYRIAVDEGDQQATIVVWEGSGEAFGEDASFPLAAGDAVTFYDTDLRDYEWVDLPREDQFDRYCHDRDLRFAQSESLRYVDESIPGYADLDGYGRWRTVSSYGAVWFPNRVAAGWAPYRDGHGVWQEPWGWTWVDNAPWGFAPSHYGRWVYVSNRWGWIPGPPELRPVYAPALVAFIGGDDFSLSIAWGGDSEPIGWFPLGPRDIYVPSYAASRDYFTRVNINNTVINTTVINHYYGSYSRGDAVIEGTLYANRSVSGAITVVPDSVFVNARPVREQAIRVDERALSRAEVRRLAKVAPSQRSVMGAAAGDPSPPARAAFEREVIARSAPPPDPRPSSSRERQLQRNPGLAVDPRAPSAPSDRRSGTPQNIRLVPDRGELVNVRESEPRRGAADRPADSDRSPPMRPQDRDADARNPRQREFDERDRDATARSRDQGGRNRADRPPEAFRQAEREPEAELRRQQREQEQAMQAERARQSARQREADARQREDQQRRQAAAERGVWERQQIDVRRQQGEVQRQHGEAQRRQQVERDQRASEQIRIERERHVQRERDASDSPRHPPRFESAPKPRDDREHPRGKGRDESKDEDDGKGKRGRD